MSNSAMSKGIQRFLEANKKYDSAIDYAHEHDLPDDTLVIERLWDKAKSYYDDLTVIEQRQVKKIGIEGY